MTPLHNHINGNSIIIYLDRSIYSSNVILKCLYWYGDKFHTDFRSLDSTYYCVTLSVLAAETEQTDLEAYQLKFERDIIDYSLRDTVTKETANIRDLLIAKAFSNGEYDEEPAGEVSDPVGFDVHAINPYQN
ncbi:MULTISPECIES: His-Xaa-Ser system protein HxsD [unclassified Pedobacter]|uniref:His-Xaa-Ser system protein HxsD n=1 Tax=unclassified Pedobacter TaxID=2628915 RepID=UPI001DA65465|nr:MULTISPECIES: His-Xaa-Ser system protein HxsD [unclassified Pedobacter]CAH0264273.1 hypothetical protein SRABI36_03552 [Pedobacter sp. Bi36]CAH0290775.1 hypothetical protein SRABI126_04046 [Pedobacter sp. Bi126]